MNTISPTKPSFVFSYWKPWKEDSNLFDSYLDYNKDVSLSKYTADTVGAYINQASKEQILAMDKLGDTIGIGLNALSNQLNYIAAELLFLNRNVEIQVEQQKLTNLLLQNISDLLRVPNSEKERQNLIEIGIKFFVNAKQDPDLFDDSLEELLKAEQLMKQDYFVLHRIGMIYLFSEKHINPTKALAYFTRAAKYASVESDPNALRLVNVLTVNESLPNSEVSKKPKSIQYLAAESFEKAAFSSYILGDFETAVNYQKKSLKYNECSSSYFFLAKYQARNKQIDDCITNLSIAIEGEPKMALAVFKEIDLVNEPLVLNLIGEKNDIINKRLDDLIQEWELMNSTQASKVVKEISNLKNLNYELKVNGYNNFLILEKSIIDESENLNLKIDELISAINKTIICNLNQKQTDDLVNKLREFKKMPFEETKAFYETSFENYEKNSIKIGSKYAGGIVFYIDKSGKHGLVCAEKDQGEAMWGGEGIIGTQEKIGSGKSNTDLIVEKASWHVEKIFFSKKYYPAQTAARICKEMVLNKYNDWFLPSRDELILLKEKLHSIGRGNFREDYYWSSSEIINEHMHESFSNNAIAINFGTSFSFLHYRSSAYPVRAIRKF